MALFCIARICPMSCDRILNNAHVIFTNTVTKCNDLLYNTSSPLKITSKFTKKTNIAIHVCVVIYVHV